MVPNKLVRQTLGLLMAAWKDSRPYDPGHPSGEGWVSTTESRFRVSLGRDGHRAVATAVAKCTRHLDQYPLDVFGT